MSADSIIGRWWRRYFTDVQAETDEMSANGCEPVFKKQQ